MGLNITLYRLYQTDAEPDERWDCARHSGDREFWSWLIEYNNTSRQIPEVFQWGDIPDSYLRPKDFDAAVRWVAENIRPEGNRERLLNVLQWMHDEPDLWLSASY